MRAIGLGLVALALAGCGGGAYDWRAAAGGGAGLPQVAMAPTGETVVPPGRGAKRALAVRTFVAAPGGENGGWTEVEGARCTVTAGDFLDTTVATPTRILLPDLGPDAPPLRAECETATSWGSDTVAPVFGWPVEGRPNSVARMWWGGGWWWGYQKTGPLHYPDLAIGLVPKPTGAVR